MRVSRTTRARRGLAGAGALALGISLVPGITPPSQAEPLPASSVTNPPSVPHAIDVFPQRDFVSATGFAEGETVTVELHHSVLYGGGVISSPSGLVPQDDPSTAGFDGIVEVNHPGAYGWGAVTPDIRPGDRVRIVSDTGAAQETTVAGVTGRRPVRTAADTVVVHGTAPDAAGGRLPLDALEARLVSPGNLFDKSGKRTLRATSAGGNGTLGYDDATTAAWTATFSGLTAADVDRALAAESVGIWLGNDPAAGVESTHYEIGAGVTPGPQGPGNGPLEKLPPPPGSDAEAPSDPTMLTAVVSDSNTVTLSWEASADNTGVTSYGVYRDGVAIANVAQPDGSAPAPTGYVDKNVPPGTYVYTVDAADEVGNRSLPSGAVSARTTTRTAQDVPVHEPPAGGIAMTVFPSRDFTEVDGIPDGQLATVELLRAGRVVSSSEGLIPTNGVVEVNHPGGGCWEGVTPEIRAFDIVRVRLYDSATGAEVSAHQIHVANVSAGKAVQTGPGTVQVHGFAQGHDGRPLPLDQIEARLVASTKNPFGKNGRRTLRAPEDGTLAYDTVDNPLGTAFTATFSDLDAADVRLALSVEARVMWLGRDPLAGLELTIYEAGSADQPGPAAGFCTSPIEAPDTQAPEAPALTATPDGPARTVALSWTAVTDDEAVYGYRVSRDGVPVTNLPASALSWTDTDVPPGEHGYTVQAYDAASALGAGADAAERLAAGQGRPYGNLSSAAAPTTVTLPDVAAPAVPADLRGTTPAPGTVQLSWLPSADDSAGPVTYVVTRDGQLVEGPVQVGADGRVGYTDSGLTVGVYAYTVQAVDEAGNRSASSAPVTVHVTEVPDASAPTVPGSLLAATPDLRVPDVHVTWAESTDDVAVTGYRVYRGGVPIADVAGDVRGYVDRAVPAGTHSYTVDAVDSAGNRSEQSGGSTAVTANDPPAGGRSITAFPARDFVEASGYTGPVTVQVWRQVAGSWQQVGTADAAPDAAGLVEVNHAGPGCWDTVTPDLRAGDLVRVIDQAGVADQTVTQDLTVQRPVQTSPGTVVVRGTARSALGLPIDASRLEQRIVSGGAQFTRNGRRAILTPADGTFTLDTSGAFTATYTGLSAADVTRALNGESIVSWLGRDAAAGNELTIMENGSGTDGGPAAGACTAPLEGGVALAGWTPAQHAYGDQVVASSTVRNVTLTNVGVAPMEVSAVHLAGADPQDFDLTPVALPATLQAGQQLVVQVAFAPTGVGSRSASLNFVDTAANTTFQNVRLTGSGINAGAPSTPGVPQQTLDSAGVITGSRAPVTLSWTGATGMVTRYEVEVSVAGGAYARTTAQPGTAAALSVTVPAGSAHRYRVRACNGTLCSAWATAAAFTLTAVQENAGSVVVKGTWTRVTLAGAFGGSVRHNSTAGSSATAKATTGGFQLVSTVGPNRGRAEVWADGVRVGTVDLYAATQRPASVVFSRQGLDPTRSHTFELRPLGNRNAASTANRVDLDAFVTMR